MHCRYPPADLLVVDRVAVRRLFPFTQSPYGQYVLYYIFSSLWTYRWKTNCLIPLIVHFAQYHLSILIVVALLSMLSHLKRLMYLCIVTDICITCYPWDRSRASDCRWSGYCRIYISRRGVYEFIRKSLPVADEDATGSGAMCGVTGTDHMLTPDAIVYIYVSTAPFGTGQIFFVSICLMSTRCVHRYTKGMLTSSHCMDTWNGRILCIYSDGDKRFVTFRLKVWIRPLSSEYLEDGMTIGSVLPWPSYEHISTYYGHILTAIGS